MPEMGCVSQGVAAGFQREDRGWSIGWRMGGASRVCHENMHLQSDRLVAQGSAEGWGSGQAA